MRKKEDAFGDNCAHTWRRKFSIVKNGEKNCNTMQAAQPSEEVHAQITHNLCKFAAAVSVL